MTGSLDEVPGGVITLSEGLQILAVNRTLGELVGRDPGELVGERLDILLSAPSTILFQTHVYPALRADGRVEEVFLTFVSSDGETIPVLLNAVRVATPDGVHFEGLIVRIRARARWERDLLTATRALEEERAASARLAADLGSTLNDLEARYAEEARNRQFHDAFVGVVGHELRTPITTILGMSHILRERLGSMDHVTATRHLDDIVDESERLRRLTEDLLVLSRAEARQLRIETEPLVIGHLVRRVVDVERRRFPEHVLAVEADIDVPLVLGEDAHVEQVLRNLVGNAGKYSPVGSTVRVTVVAEDDGAAVRVIDQGPGIGNQPPDELFEIFFRTPEAVRKSGGAGIGLFVCRELTRAMGGRVWAAPAPPPAELGAEFGFWLPTAEGDDHEG